MTGLEFDILESKKADSVVKIEKPVESRKQESRKQNLSLCSILPYTLSPEGAYCLLSGGTESSK